MADIVTRLRDRQDEDHGLYSNAADHIEWLEKFQLAAQEFTKGCSCAPKTAPQNCSECTAAYVQHLLYLLSIDVTADGDKR